MKSIFALMIGTCISVLLIISGCGKGKSSLTLAGSTAFQPFAEKLAGLYMEKNKNIMITVQGGGSAVGVQSALSGAAQIGMADLVTLPDEAKNLTSIVVAKDGIAMIVHNSNKIENLTTDQVRDIYNGKIKSWKELGGADAPITLVSRESGSGTRSSFEKIISNIELSKTAVIQNSNGTIRETVANDPNSIGYISHGLINDKVKPLQLDGVKGSFEEIMSGNYKLVRSVYFLIKGNPQGDVKNFIDYILSAEGQNTIKADGLIPAK